MPNLKLSEWANVAEISVSFIVVASLVYIGLEVNQNTQALQIDSYQSMSDSLLQLDIAQASNEDLNRIITLAETSPSDVTAEEWARFTKMAYPRYGVWEYVYLSAQENAVSESQWLAFGPYFLTEFACKRGYRQFWEEHHLGFSPLFIEYMQSEVLPTCGEN